MEYDDNDIGMARYIRMNTPPPPSPTSSPSPMTISSSSSTITEENSLSSPHLPGNNNRLLKRKTSEQRQQLEQGNFNDDGKINKNNNNDNNDINDGDNGNDINGQLSFLTKAIPITFTDSPSSLSSTSSSYPSSSRVFLQQEQGEENWLPFFRKQEEEEEKELSSWTSPWFRYFWPTRTTNKKSRSDSRHYDDDRRRQLALATDSSTLVWMQDEDTGAMYTYMQIRTCSCLSSNPNELIEESSNLVHDVNNDDSSSTNTLYWACPLDTNFCAIPQTDGFSSTVVGGDSTTTATSTSTTTSTTTTTAANHGTTIIHVNCMKSDFQNVLARIFPLTLVTVYIYM